MFTILCLKTLGLLGAGDVVESAPRPALAPLVVQLERCVDGSVVRTTLASERQATVRPTSNGQTLAAYETRDEKRVEATFEVLDCRGGVPQRLRVRYGEVLERRLDPASRPAEADADAVPREPTFTTERGPLANRAFLIVQTGESVAVVGEDGSPAAPQLTQLVLEREDLDGGAVPLPGDAFARMIAAASPKPGDAILVDPVLAKSLLGRDETATVRGRLTYVGLEKTPNGPPRARFEARFVLHDESQPGTLRDANLTGTLTTDPITARPLTLELSGSEKIVSTTADSRTTVVRDVNGTWRIRRTWEWR